MDGWVDRWMVQQYVDNNERLSAQEPRFTTERIPASSRSASSEGQCLIYWGSALMGKDGAC